jgi:hypothetical protein
MTTLVALSRQMEGYFKLSMLKKPWKIVGKTILPRKGLNFADLLPILHHSLDYYTHLCCYSTAIGLKCSDGVVIAVEKVLSTLIL